MEELNVLIICAFGGGCGGGGGDGEWEFRFIIVCWFATCLEYLCTTADNDNAFNVKKQWHRL